MAKEDSIFQVRRPQVVAAFLLAAFLLQGLLLIGNKPLSEAERRTSFAAMQLYSSESRMLNATAPDDGILASLSAGFLPTLQSKFGESTRGAVYAAPSRWPLRLPFLVFGAWLGAALWWVSRRLFNDWGGYVALGLYCFSSPLLLSATTVSPGIIATWGVFGIVYSGIGIGHTLYAPPRKWFARIVLLGLAIGLTAAAHVAAAFIALLLATGFMLYLAPGKRLAGLATFFASTVIGLFVLLICYRFAFGAMGNALKNGLAWTPTLRAFAALAQAPPAYWLALLGFIMGIIVFAAWRRARYFGNLSPLIAFAVLAFTAPRWSGSYLTAPLLWALPFAFVFIGGIAADLLEARFADPRARRAVIGMIGVLLAGNAALSLMAIASV